MFFYCQVSLLSVEPERFTVWRLSFCRRNYDSGRLSLTAAVLSSIKWLWLRKFMPVREHRERNLSFRERILIIAICVRRGDMVCSIVSKRL